MFRTLFFALAFTALLGGSACTMIMPKEITASMRQAKAYATAHPEAFGIENGIHRARAGTPNTPEGTSKPLLLLLHGTPGDWGAWAGQLDDPALTNRFHIVVPDRPGYGKSSPGVPFTSLSQHAKEFADLVASHPGPKIWAGHSFGAPIVVRAAIDHPDAVDAAILISGGLDPAHEQIKWYHKLANTWLVRNILPTSIRMANDEVYRFFDELTVMESEWDHVRCPTWVVHGVKDRLAVFAEAEFAMENLTNAPTKLVAIEDGGHLIVWSHQDDIRKVFVKAADAIQP